MPSRITETLTDEGCFLSVHIYSYSEDGMYDDSTGYTKCVKCGSTIADEYEYCSEQELEDHKTGLCVEQKATRKFVIGIARSFGSLLKRCTFCQHVECDCPF